MKSVERLDFDCGDCPHTELAGQAQTCRLLAEAAKLTFTREDYYDTTPDHNIPATLQNIRDALETSFRAKMHSTKQAPASRQQWRRTATREVTVHIPTPPKSSITTYIPILTRRSYYYNNGINATTIQALQAVHQEAKQGCPLADFLSHGPTDCNRTSNGVELLLSCTPAAVDITRSTKNAPAGWWGASK